MSAPSSEFGDSDPWSTWTLVNSAGESEELSPRETLSQGHLADSSLDSLDESLVKEILMDLDPVILPRCELGEDGSSIEFSEEFPRDELADDDIQTDVVGEDAETPSGLVDRPPGNELAGDQEAEQLSDVEPEVPREAVDFHPPLCSCGRSTPRSESDRSSDVEVLLDDSSQDGGRAERDNISYETSYTVLPDPFNGRFFVEERRRAPFNDRSGESVSDSQSDRSSVSEVREKVVPEAVTGCDSITVTDSELQLAVTKNRSYTHTPNPRLNICLSFTLTLTVTMVISMGLGHFLGFTGRHYHQQQLHNTHIAKLMELQGELLECLQHSNTLRHISDQPSEQPCFEMVDYWQSRFDGILAENRVLQNFVDNSDDDDDDDMFEDSDSAMEADYRKLKFHHIKRQLANVKDKRSAGTMRGWEEAIGDEALIRQLIKDNNALKEKVADLSVAVTPADEEDGDASTREELSSLRQKIDQLKMENGELKMAVSRLFNDKPIPLPDVATENEDDFHSTVPHDSTPSSDSSPLPFDSSPPPSDSSPTPSDSSPPPPSDSSPPPTSDSSPPYDFTPPPSDPTPPPSDPTPPPSDPTALPSDSTPPPSECLPPPSIAMPPEIQSERHKFTSDDPLNTVLTSWLLNSFDELNLAGFLKHLKKVATDRDTAQDEIYKFRDTLFFGYDQMTEHARIGLDSGREIAARVHELFFDTWYKDVPKQIAASMREMVLESWSKGIPGRVEPESLQQSANGVLKYMELMFQSTMDMLESDATAAQVQDRLHWLVTMFKYRRDSIFRMVWGEKEEEARQGKVKRDLATDDLISVARADSEASRMRARMSQMEEEDGKSSQREYGNPEDREEASPLIVEVVKETAPYERPIASGTVDAATKVTHDTNYDDKTDRASCPMSGESENTSMMLEEARRHWLDKADEDEYDDDDDDEDKDDVDKVKPQTNKDKTDTVNATSSSEWAFKRADGRKSQRHSKRRGDWIFERAQDRQHARKEAERAEWYFDRAKGRYEQRITSKKSDEKLAKKREKQMKKENKRQKRSVSDSDSDDSDDADERDVKKKKSKYDQRRQRYYNRHHAQAFDWAVPDLRNYHYSY